MKDKNFTVRLSQEELEAVKGKAAIAKLSMSRYLAKSGLGRKIDPPIPDDIRKNVAGFGRNLNQLAHHANSMGKIELEAVEALRAAATDIIRALSETRGK